MASTDDVKPLLCSACGNLMLVAFIVPDKPGRDHQMRDLRQDRNGLQADRNSELAPSRRIDLVPQCSPNALFAKLEMLILRKLPHMTWFGHCIVNVTIPLQVVSVGWPVDVDQWSTSFPK
jgi:hypothetical protein